MVNETKMCNVKWHYRLMANTVYKMHYSALKKIKPTNIHIAYTITSFTEKASIPV